MTCGERRFSVKKARSQVRLENDTEVGGCGYDLTDGYVSFLFFFTAYTIQRPTYGRM